VTVVVGHSDSGEGEAQPGIVAVLDKDFATRGCGGRRAASRALREASQMSWGLSKHYQGGQQRILDVGEQNLRGREAFWRFVNCPLRISAPALAIPGQTEGSS
jgi:hypothetical protein